MKQQAIRVLQSHFSVEVYLPKRNNMNINTYEGKKYNNVTLAETVHNLNQTVVFTGLFCPITDGINV